MDNLIGNKKILISDGYKTPFRTDKDIYQDGTIAFCRDKRGRLWAIAGHSHMGHIGMFCGGDLTDIKEVYPIALNFCVGHADYAFNRIPYPEGVKARGSVWPFGLYICPETNRFFCFFHNETGWNGRGTAYDAFGLCEQPRFDSDFRHIGLMHSDDEGRTWTFDRWVLSSEAVCFTEKYAPEAGRALGQKAGVIGLGSGDFTFYDDPTGEYIYLFYNIVHIDMESGAWKDCDAYVARSVKRKDGIMGDFVKYYNGSFCEAGNFGRESAIVKNSWHPRIVYSETLNAYIMASSPILPDCKTTVVADYLELRTSADLLTWSEPVSVEKDGKKFGSHYHTPLPFHGKGKPQILGGDEFTVLCGHNGTDVSAYDFRLLPDERD